MTHTRRTITTLSLTAAAALTGCLAEPAIDDNSKELGFAGLEETTTAPCSAISGCPPPWQGVFLWRGFNQEWGYNHRLNRLGDHIKPSSCTEQNGTTDCESTVVHAAASGSGPDDAEWKSLHTFVSTNSARFWHKNHTLRLSGGEGDWVEGEFEVVEKTDEPNSVAVLRGFDIAATESADRLKKLTIKITDEWYDSSTGEFHFKVYAGGKFDCGSLECPLFNNGVDYDVKVYATLIAGEEGSFNHVQGPLVSTDDHTQLRWDQAAGANSGPEIFRRDFRIEGESITGHGRGFYPSAALAFRRLTVGLDTDHHMLELDMALLPQNYNPNTGVYDYDMRLFFKQWAADMAQAMAEQLLQMNPIDRELSGMTGCLLFPGSCVLESAGDGELKASVVLLQFATGSSETGTVSGTKHWGGMDADATGASAEHSKTARGSYTH